MREICLSGSGEGAVQSRPYLIPEDLASVTLGTAFSANGAAQFLIISRQRSYATASPAVVGVSGPKTSVNVAVKRGNLILSIRENILLQQLIQVLLPKT